MCCQVLIDLLVYNPGTTAIGLKLLGSDKEPDLCNGVTVADFQSVGTIEVRSDKLWMYVKGSARTSAPAFRNRVWMFFKPDDFFIFNEDNSFLTKFSLISVKLKSSTEALTL